MEIKAGFLTDSGIENNNWLIDYSDDNNYTDANIKCHEITFKSISASSETGTLFVDIEITGWSRENYLLFPGAVYSGNRFKSIPFEYPPLITDPDMMIPETPVIITDIHRLSDSENSSFIELFSGDMAFPCMGMFDPAANKATFITTKQKTLIGDILFKFSENLNENRAVLRLSSPGIRQMYRYSMCHMDREKSGDEPYLFEPGEEVKFEFSIHEYACVSVAEFFRVQMEIRSSYENQNMLDSSVPFSYAWNLVEESWNNFRWMEKEEYYWSFPGIFFNNMMDYQLGWVGGVIAAYALYNSGNSISKERAISNFATIVNKTQSESGLFYGSGNKGEFFSDGIFGEPWPDNMTSIRKNADALYFLMKFIIFESKREIPNIILEVVKEKTKILADAMCEIWTCNKQFGQIVDIKDKSIKIGGSAAGGLIPAGLALASKIFSSKYYLEVAIESGNYFYNNFTAKGITNGGPIEILQCPDSESAFALLESFVVLFEKTGDRDFLNMAEDAAAQFSSWCVPYNFEFPKNSEFGKWDMQTKGTVIANSQNKHSAPGICTMSGDGLFKLYRATGEIKYLDLVRSISHSIPQYISRNDRPITAWDGREMPSGWICERVNMSDWEGRENIGGVFYCPCWCEVSMLLTWAEIPGIYLQADVNRLFVFDHVECNIQKADDKYTELCIYNPAEFDAKVKLFVENKKDCSKLLDPDWMTGCKVVEVKTKESVTIRI